MSTFIVAVVGGISLGATFALIALGMVLAFRATRTFNFAQGEFMVIPALFVGAAEASHSHSLVGVIEGLALVAAIGAAFYYIVLQRTSGFLTTIATLGLASVLDGVIQLIWQGQSYNLNFSFVPSGTVTLLGARISTGALFWAIFTFLLVAVIAALLQFTQLGRQVRISGQDPVLASQSGINVRVVHMTSWAIAAILGGIAGIAYAQSSEASLTIVQLPLLAAPVMVLGGLDSLWGVIVAGLAVGLFQNFVGAYFNSGAQQACTYGLLLVLIIFIPQGLFGTREVRRV